MRLNRFIRFISIFLSSVVAILFFTSQQKHGRFSAVILEAKPLEISQPFTGRSGSTDMLGQLGGITSEMTAAPVPDLRVRSLNIVYNPSETDGARLVLKINQKGINCTIPDWQLLPIAQFVNTPNTACISLLGELTDKEIEKQIRLNGGHIINYHPAFFNTRMGMQLLEHELSLLNPDGIEGIQKDLSEKHRSWVLSDMQHDILFSIENRQLKISAMPEYFFWRYESDAPDMDETKNENRFSAMNSILLHEFEADLAIYNKGLIDETSFRKIIRERALTSVPDMINLHYAIAKVYFDEVDLLGLSMATESQRLEQFLNSLSTGDLIATWTRTVQINTLYRVKPMHEYSKAVNTELQLMQSIIPDAWETTINLLQYSAFFRYIKKSFPSEWKSFTNSLEGVDLEDPVQTPTALYPSDNLQLEQFFN